MWKEDEEFDRLIDHAGLASGRDLFRPEAAKRMGVPSFLLRKRISASPRTCRGGSTRSSTAGFADILWRRTRHTFARL